jgi:hypothetical protein
MAGLLGDFLSWIDSKKRIGGDNLLQLATDPVERFNRAEYQVADQMRPFVDAAASGDVAGTAIGLLSGGAMPMMAGVVSPARARALNTIPALPAAPEFRQAVANTPGAQLSDSGLLMQVMRNQKPEQALEDSVRGGVFYLPEGAKQARYYGTGKAGYGGAERVAGETLLQNPLLAKGGTGGRAPKSAYDELIGKGAYEAMRSDAINVHRYVPGGHGTSDVNATSMQVQKFLEKYAPEMSSLAEHIVENSQKGNQLAYALQEAAVGSAVRRAGHDAVLGYSKGKAGPFLSEVFDVRERNYPDKFGTATNLWDAFK